MPLAAWIQAGCAPRYGWFRVMFRAEFTPRLASRGMFRLASKRRSDGGLGHRRFASCASRLLVGSRRFAAAASSHGATPLCRLLSPWLRVVRYSWTDFPLPPPSPPGSGSRRGCQCKCGLGCAYPRSSRALALYDVSPRTLPSCGAPSAPAWVVPWPSAWYGRCVLCIRRGSFSQPLDFVPAVPFCLVCTPRGTWSRSIRPRPCASRRVELGSPCLCRRLPVLVVCRRLAVVRRLFCRPCLLPLRVAAVACPSLALGTLKTPGSFFGIEATPGSFSGREAKS